jgi:hypothetical protein
MKLSSLILTGFLTGVVAGLPGARAQVVAATPAADDSGGAPVNGELNYSLRYSQSTQFGNGQDGQQMSYVSGDATYTNLAKRRPFSMQYGGGYGWGWNGPSSGGNVFQHLMLSQGLIGRAWSLSASENVSYTFETPTTGFTGVAGSGEPITGSGTSSSTSQSVLALNTRTVNDFTDAGLAYRVDATTSVHVSGSSGQSHFLDGNGQNTSSLGANAGVSRTLNARNSCAAEYSFTRFYYDNTTVAAAAGGGSFDYTQVASMQLSFTRQWNRSIASSAYAGPQWLSSSNSKLEPASTALSAGVSVSDHLRFGNASLSYSHGTSGGSGFMLGSKVDSISASFRRDFGKNLSVATTGGYTHSVALTGAGYLSGALEVTNEGVTNSRLFSAQATRKLGQYLSANANYTLIGQSSSLQEKIEIKGGSWISNPSVLNGTYQIISFGIGYSPRSTRLRK